MPCFKGLAVSIHTPNGPLPEYAVQKASRLSRISTYIPVPPPAIPPNSTSNKPEPSTFAISITLLTPGQDVPYSTPKKTPQNPNPKPRVVGALPGHTDDRRLVGSIGPYVPLTTSPNETIAAYIYFDGRAKEEVATLLRKGEETWVNSRWVGVPESEGGGLAEREFLFREVGLERWLNGLDLAGKDAAATIERRRLKLEKRRRRKRKEKTIISDDDDDDDDNNDNNNSSNDGVATKSEAAATRTPRRKSKNTMKYGPDGQLENLSDDDDDDDLDGLDSSSLDNSSSSDDDDPIPEAAGQIKVALFRVLASGEIKRGEYSPQFGAHDDDEEGSQNGQANGSSATDTKPDIDHTTSFAKPKSLDPKTISTQTVTGIDPTDKPYAVFTFFYRGERQLQKMGILQPKSDKPVANAKRRSLIGEIPKLTPLKKPGSASFSGFRDAQPAQGRRRSKHKREKDDGDDDMDSDSDENDAGPDLLDKIEDVNEADTTAKDPSLLSPEDAERTGQVAEGIRKIKLKRQHSAEPLASNGSAEPRKTSKSGSGSPSAASTPVSSQNNNSLTAGACTGAGAGASASAAASAPNASSAAPGTGERKKAGEEDDFMLGSPLKKQRSSAADFDDEFKRRLQRGLASGIGQILGGTSSSSAPPPSSSTGLQFGGSLKNNASNASNSNNNRNAATAAATATATTPSAGKRLDPTIDDDAEL